MELNTLLEKQRKESDDVIARMDNEMNKVRTGRANPSILDPVMVDSYGTLTHVAQLANISIPEARQLVIKPYDRNFVKAICKAIVDANIGVNPQDDGDKIRLNFPALTEEVRKDMVKKVHVIAEQAKVGIRNARKNVKDKIKQIEEAKSEDYERYCDKEIQAVHDKYIKQIDELEKKKAEQLTKI